MSAHALAAARPQTTATASSPTAAPASRQAASFAPADRSAVGLARPTMLQRRCACGGEPGPDGECAACKARRLALQRQPFGPGPGGVAPPIVHAVVGSPGQPLDAGARAFMEPRFGHAFGDVRVHADASAAESASAVGALAYTVGRDIVFGQGQYRPDTAAGRRLIAHELAHSVQQGGATALQPRLEVGATSDPAEDEAERIARAVVDGPAPAASGPVAPAGAAPVGPASAATGPVVLRRQWTTPQQIGDSNGRAHSLPAEQRGDEQVKVHVIRTLVACPCRQVDDAREGIFYNPDLDSLAIAYRYCRGGTTVDTYGQLQSNASSFLTGQAPPTGTARVGIDINVVGRVVGGRVIVEAIGTNDGGSGIGGRAQVIFQGGSWRVFLEPQFIRRLGDQAGGTTPNELTISLGGQIGDIQFRVDLNNLLDPSQRGGTGSASIPLGGTRVGPFIEVTPGGGVTGGLRLDVPLDVPEVRRETCRQCLCPPPTRHYTCYEDTLPRDEPVTEQVPVERQRELRYYFRLDQTTQSDDAALRAQSEANLSEIASQVNAGGRVDYIFGYASPEYIRPEATERHNERLSLGRATRLRDLIQSRVGPSVALPEPNAGGELLGRRPAPTPSSKLGDAIHEGGFRSAEDLSIFLAGEEISNDDLSDQFLSLFAAIPEDADRLALFGLTGDDPVAPHVLDAVRRFEATRGRGPRPWEGVFKALRYAVARVSRTEMVEQQSTVHHSGSLRELPEADCTALARRAEAENGFGPIDESARRPTTSSEDSNDDCLIRPQDADRRRGCDYTVPPSLRQRPSAPSMAPRELR